ncbi:flagellar hook-associated protein FlgL [Carboxydochorda subterranea]|uniref:Flagellar hook-associated protein FlgL n=1 Tax=Carboxydichorda subterranea TaxID=3109565 RepID=A0ABZ1BZ60_9FIRM|nr:flagellar hook-associated protein FlgL [Limnochorda sp. L945t]WRP17883.1 flagellar hook-associated protein FlgL [Limnochorda sp. L945t]
MRISSRTLVDHVLVNLQRNYARLDRLQQQLSSGKRVSFPSDDPASATTAMRLHTAVLDNQQYIKNTDAAIGWLETTDAALQDIVSALHSAREITIAGARSDLPDDARRAYAEKMDQLIRHVVQAANASHDGRYVFAGTKTDTKPYDVTDNDKDGFVDDVTFAGNGGEFAYEVGPGVKQTVNVPGTFAFGHGVPTPVPGSISGGLFRALITIRDDLANGNVSNLSGQDLQDLDAALDGVLQALDRVGARQEGFQLIQQRLQGQDVNLQDLLSKAEDLDVPKAIMDLQMQENVYRLALASGARIIQPTLLDFLK